MRNFLLIVAGLAGVAGSAVTTVAWSQGAPKTCSDAHYECKKKTGLAKECEEERQWCMKTGTFADPKTKTVLMDLQKK